MKLFSLPLAVLALSTLVSVARANDLPVPFPETQLFGPIGANVRQTSTPGTVSPEIVAKDVTAKEHAALSTKVSIEAKGLPLRAVLATTLESAKVPYAVDPALDHLIYISVKDVTLREAVAILGKLADFEVRVENGVWYASRVRIKAKVAKSSVAPVASSPVRTAPVAKTAMAKTTAPKTSTAKSGSAKSGSAKNGVSTQEILVDATPRKAIVPMRVKPPVPTRTATLPINRTKFPVGSDETTKAVASKTVATASGKPSLTRRVNTKLHKTDLREVFEAFSQQTGIAISVDADVPKYKIDAFMKGCSLKYALDRICEATGLTYEARGSAIQISQKS